MTSKADTKVIVDPGQDDLKYKKAHTFSDAGSFFPLHRNLFIMNIFFFIVLIVCGVLLILCGNYGNTGYFSFMSLTNKYPGVAVADEVTTALTLELLQLSCWIGGFCFIFFSFISLYKTIVLYKLMLARRPWEREQWNQPRKDGDNILINGKVRDKSLNEQVEYLNPEQKRDMNLHFRPVVEPK